MRIELASLEGAKGQFAHSYEPGELVFDDERVHLLEPPRVSGRIFREAREVTLTGRLVARIKVDCDRCLKSIQLPIDSSFKLKYVTTEEYQAQDVAELSDEDMTLSVFDGEVIDIDELVREQLLLAVPAHLLCMESCRGICPICGADRNSVDCSCEAGEADPRWAGLRKLVNGK
jgi:uncharacterized protein